MYSSERTRRRPVAMLVSALALVTGLVLSLAPSMAVAAPVAVPTAAQQLDWVVSATSRAPVPTDEIEQHFSGPALAALGGADRFNDVLASVPDQRIVYRTRTTPTVAEAVTRTGDGAELLTTVTVDRDGLIQVLFFADRPAAPTSWTQVDEQLRTLAPQVSFSASTVDADGSCHRVHGLDADRPQPLGSAFKLYVLGALARAVARHTASWDESLAIRDAWKSLPSGELQDSPAGTRLTLAEFADKMISISDNTAADHLLHRLGRRAVTDQLTRFGNTHAALSLPFLTTRELFVLKGVRYPQLARAYAAAPPLLRTLLLKAVDAVPRARIESWTEPRNVGSIEWFGSADDLCRALAGLQQQSQQPGMAPLAHALSINDGGLAVDPQRYPTVWFKGGSEPGVLTLNYLVRSADGRTTVVSALFADPGKPLDEDALIAKAQAIIRGALDLSA